MQTCTHQCTLTCEQLRLQRIERSAAALYALLSHQAGGDEPSIDIVAENPELAATLAERLNALADALGLR